MFAVIMLNFKEIGLSIREICSKGADGMSNSVDPDQTADLGLHYLPRPICPKT